MFDLAQSALLVNLLKMRTVLFAPRSRLASIEYTITPHTVNGYGGISTKLFVGRSKAF